MLGREDLAAEKAAAAAHRVAHYAARQPILTVEERVFGYELLYRSGEENQFYCPNPDDATRSVIDMSSLLGLDILCDDRQAFLNCTREILLSEFVTLLPPNNVVLEVLPSVEADEDVTTALDRLKKMGYKIALDDYRVDDPREALVDYADFLKVDLKTTPLKDAEKLAARKGYLCKMVAQKVESREDYAIAKRAGYHLFQGYFFRRPQMVRTWSGSSAQVSSLNLLREVSRAELDWDEVEKEIKCDATLCYRLLRYLNSPFFGFRSEIRTVRQALMILGETEVRRWCRLAVTVDMTKNKPSDLLLAALTRARLSELLGERLSYADSDLFLLGLLSLIDSILEIPMQRALDALHVHHDLKSALLEEESSLTPVYRLVVAVEAGAWDEAARWCESMGLTESFVAETLWRAMEWAHEVSAMGVAA